MFTFWLRGCQQSHWAAPGTCSKWHPGVFLLSPAREISDLIAGSPEATFGKMWLVQWRESLLMIKQLPGLVDTESSQRLANFYFFVNCKWDRQRCLTPAFFWNTTGVAPSHPWFSFPFSVTQNQPWSNNSNRRSYKSTSQFHLKPSCDVLLFLSWLSFYPSMQIILLLQYQRCVCYLPVSPLIITLSYQKDYQGNCSA